jgi:hypothetical protein
MAKSSYAVVLLLAGWGTDASAQAPAAPLTADAAMKRYEQWLKTPELAACAESGNASDADILVCGRRSRQAGPRLPLPIEREPGEVVHHINEAGGAPLNACYSACYQPLKIDMIGVARAVPKIINHILGKDD